MWGGVKSRDDLGDGVADGDHLKVKDDCFVPFRAHTDGPAWFGLWAVGPAGPEPALVVAPDVAAHVEAVRGAAQYLGGVPLNSIPELVVNDAQYRDPRAALASGLDDLFGLPIRTRGSPLVCVVVVPVPEIRSLDVRDAADLHVRAMPDQRALEKKEAFLACSSTAYRCPVRCSREAWAHPRFGFSAGRLRRE